MVLGLPNTSGGEAGVRVQLPGAEAITVAAPPVYDPHGRILFLPALSHSRTALPAAVVRAPQLGCPAIVVTRSRGDDALSETGFRRHCDYYTEAINSI